MQRVIIVPISDAARFPGLEVIVRVGGIAALAGPTVPGRSREAYDSDEDFLEAVAHGFADRYNFATLDEAAHSQEVSSAIWCGKHKRSRVRSPPERGISQVPRGSVSAWI